MLYKAVNRIRGWILAMLKWTQSAPPREIPAELDESYTLQGQIPVQNRYRNDVYPSFIPRFYSRSEVNTYINKATRKEAFYYKKTSTWMYEAIEKYSIKGCDVAVMGSTFRPVRRFVSRMARNRLRSSTTRSYQLTAA